MNSFWSYVYDRFTDGGESKFQISSRIRRLAFILSLGQEKTLL